MTRYVTVADLKDYLRNEKPTEDDGFYEDAIDTAEMALDNACARRFVVASGSSARVFAPPRGDVLRIFDAVSVTSIAISSATLATTAYQLEPLNALSLAGEAVPYDQVRLLSGTWGTPTGEATISVTGSWGWAAIPSQIVEACKIAAKAVIEGRDLQYGLVGFTEAGAITEREARVVRNAVQSYRRVESFGFA